MGRWSHELAVRRTVQTDDYAPTPLPTMQERRAQRWYLMQTLDLNLPLILSEALRCRRRKEFMIVFQVPLEGMNGNRRILEYEQVKDVIRLWVWQNFHGAIGFTSYTIRPQGDFEVHFTT